MANRAHEANQDNIQRGIDAVETASSDYVPTTTGPLPTITGSIPVLEDAADQDIACRPDAEQRAKTRSQVTGLVILVLTTLSAIGPLATDMYIPAFPQVRLDLNTSATLLQLTITAFFIGTASGQVVAGPLSDRAGRRLPLLFGIALCLVGSLGCALAPNIQLMLLFRLIQGIGGGFGMVLGRAVLIDLTDGPELFRIMNIMQGISGIAPIVAPLLGGIVINFAQWHDVFFIIAGMSALSFLGTIFLIPESLPRERRHSGGFRTFLGNCRILLTRRAYVAYLLVNAFSSLVLMSYVSASSPVAQNILGFTPGGFSIIFAINSLGMMCMSFLSARLTRRFHPRVLIGVGLTLSGAAAFTLLIAVTLMDTPAFLILPGFFVTVLSQGLIFGNGGALASSAAREFAGTGSALLGLGFSFSAATAAPLVGLAGPDSALPMAIVMVCGWCLSVFCYLVLAKPSKV